LTYGAYFCELIDIACVAEESNKELFKLLVSSLYIMKSKAVDYEVLARAFELKFLNLTGYGVDFERCSNCSRKISSSNYISFQNYGGVCSECEKANGIYISPGTFSAIRFLNNLPLDKTYRVNLPEEVRSEVNKILSMLIGVNYSRKPKSLNMLDFFKEGKKNE
jgi:DNA repair protein RecO (recombination protein O)